MRILGLGALLLFLAALWSCGGGDSSNLEEPGFYDSIPVKDTSLRFDASAFEDLIKKREARGDTVPRKHVQLRAILPDSLPGFKPDINEGGTFQTKDFAFSEATRVFYDANEEYIEINVADYIADYDFFASVLQRHDLANGMEIEGVLESRIPVNHPEAFSWRSWNPEKRIARLYLGFDFRYFITLEQTGGADTRMLEGILQKMDWKSLK